MTDSARPVIREASTADAAGNITLEFGPFGVNRMMLDLFNGDGLEGIQANM